MVVAAASAATAVALLEQEPAAAAPTRAADAAAAVSSVYNLAPTAARRERDGSLQIFLEELGSLLQQLLA